MSSYKLNRSNGLSKSSSQPNYLIPYELNDYNKVYLPLIKINQQAEILSNKIDKTNRIKDEILASKYKLYNNRGINNNYNYYRNKFKDSWDNFYKRKEREKRRKRIYKIIKDEPYISSEEEEDDEIFRSNYKPNKIEDKIKLKQYLPAKRDLAKLMFRINDNINERIDKNSYLLSKNIINLENGYGELKDMIQNKINKLERKQEEDFYDLRLYFKRRAQREKDKFDNNKLILENGNDTYIVNNNIEDSYNYKPNMKNNIEKLQTYEIAKRIQNIPNLFDNMIKDIEEIRKQRKKEKSDFLLNFNNQINDYYENIYENIDDDLIGEKHKYNEYTYNLDNYNDSFMGFEDTFLTGNTYNYYNNKYRNGKPRTEYRKNNKKDILSMSKSDILSLKKNLKPLSYQTPKNNKINLNDNDDSLTASDLKEIYKQKNEKKNTLDKKSNKISSNKEISIKENKIFNKSKESKEKKETNKKEESDNDVVVVDSDDDKTKSQKKETKNEEKDKKEEVNNTEKKEENKKTEKKEDNSDEEKEESEKSEEEGSKENKNDDENNDDENNEENEE